ncbi:L-threonine ammonia-lyase [bacterium HR40]|nr:L-threonine ammonia-lyase [bacterium HR40]
MTEPAAPDFDDIRAAFARIRGHLVHTPCLLSRTLSEIHGCELWLKFENLQYTASFKERGALNRLLALGEEERERGVVAASAGNHAQGVAYHASRLGVRAVIVMPRSTPFVKIENTAKLGGEVVLFGESVEEAADHALALAREQGLVFIHPYDDPAVIAGQGTVALEMLEQVPGLEWLVVPVGGGGLISGMAIAAKTLVPQIRITGVEAALFPAVKRLLAGQAGVLGGPTIAEGIAVKQPGRLALPVIRRLVDEIRTVEEASIEAAIVELLEIEKTVVEGAGAVTLAAVADDPVAFRGRRVGLVLSGGNIDSRILSAVILRGLVRTHRLVRFRVALPDSPGSLARVTALVAEAGGNIVDVVHQRAFSRLSVKQADVDFTIETRNAAHAREIERRLEASGFPVRPLQGDGGS